MKSRMMKLFVCAYACASSASFSQDAHHTLDAEVVQTEASSTPQSQPNPQGFATSTCSSGKNRRLIKVVQAATDGQSSCEVRYEKETEQPGQVQVLWSAKDNLVFCQEKAAAFVQKLVSWGWNCSGM